MGKVIGVDISQGMVDQFNSRVKELGLPEEKISATVKDITGKPDDMAQKFDVVVVSDRDSGDVQTCADFNVFNSVAWLTTTSRHWTRLPLP